MQWLSCRDGSRRVFEITPVDLDQLGSRSGWVPGRATVNGRTKVVMAPLGQVSRSKADAARRAVVEHRCDAYQRLYQAAMGAGAGSGAASWCTAGGSNPEPAD